MLINLDLIKSEKTVINTSKDVKVIIGNLMAEDNKFIQKIIVIKDSKEFCIELINFLIEKPKKVKIEQILTSEITLENILMQFAKNNNIKVENTDLTLFEIIQNHYIVQNHYINKKGNLTELMEKYNKIEIEKTKLRAEEWDEFFREYREIIDIINKNYKVDKSFKVAILIQLIDRYLNLLVRFKWAPILDFFPNKNEKLYKYIAQGTYNEEENEEIEKIIEDFFEKFYTKSRINKKLERWKKNKYLKNRIQILEEAVYAHNNKKYCLSIPVLYSQVEGIIAEYFNHTGTMKGNKVQEYLQKIIKSKSRFDDIFEKSKTDFYKNFGHGDEIFSLGRHSVIHGGDTRYGKCANSLKVILFFDYFQSKLIESEEHNNEA